MAEAAREAPRAVRRRARRALLAAALLAGPLACAGPPAPEPAPTRADFAAPRPGVVESLIAVSLHRERRGDLQGALQAAERAHRRAPSSGAAQLREAVLRAAVARRAGDVSGLELARADVERLRAEFPEAPETRLAAARLALADGRRDEAAAVARALSEERPDWAPPHTLLARALLVSDPPAALAAAEAAVSLAPSDPDALAARAAAYAAHALDSAAETDARRALRIRPDPEVSAIAARALHRSGRSRAAIAVGEAVLEAERSTALELTLVRAWWAERDQAAAVAALERAGARARSADEENEVLDVRLALGRLRGDTAQARAEIEAARRARPDDARLAELDAQVALAEGRLPAAEAAARESLQRDPKRPSAWYLMAEILERAGARPPAQERAAAALASAPGDAGASLLAGLVAERAGQVAAALEAYEAAVARDPNLAVAAMRLARLLALDGRDTGRAVRLAEGALAEIGWRFESARVLGRAHLAAEHFPEAISAYRVALGALPQLHPESEPAQLALALALARDGKRREAKGIAASLVRTAGEREPAPAWLPQAKQLLEELSAASDGPLARLP